MSLNNKTATNRNWVITRIHLIVSVVVVLPVSIVYGFKPDLQFDIHLNTIDEHNFFKAIMGLYIGFAALWFLGILNEHFLKFAIVTNIIFMLGLGCGRLVSMMLDGIPTNGYIFGVVAELALGFYGLWVLNKTKYF